MPPNKKLILSLQTISHPLLYTVCINCLPSLTLLCSKKCLPTLTLNTPVKTVSQHSSYTVVQSVSQHSPYTLQFKLSLNTHIKHTSTKCLPTLILRLTLLHKVSPNTHLTHSSSNCLSTHTLHTLVKNVSQHSSYTN